MIKKKDNTVNVTGLKPEIVKILGTVWKVATELNGINYELVITSAKDGQHKTGSKHYSGEAIDIRSRDMRNKVGLKRRLQEEIGKDYDIVIEETHIHIEYDPSN